MTKRRLGVYVCHCGGNISDYVDVEAVRAAVADDGQVVVAKTTTFACSDAAQQEMITDIQEQKLDALVVASCSPTLHQLTFRAMAERAGLNPYQYVHVNIREQCSWAHTDQREGATLKAARLVRGGVAKVALTRPLEPIVIETVPGVLVVGAGVAGMRTSLALSDLGLAVTLIEQDSEAGGAVRDLDAMFPHNRSGAEVVGSLLAEIQQRENITLFTKARLIEKSGTIGRFSVRIEVADGQTISLDVGAIVVATGFANYQPAEGEYGYGADSVITLPELRALLVGQDDGSLSHQGRPVSSIAYVYCVGSRQADRGAEGNAYCSRYCCNAALHTASLVSQRFPEVEQYHLHQGIRSYGKHELLFEEACRGGSVFIKFDEKDPPKVRAEGDETEVQVVDLLTDRTRLGLAPDLVVLVTGMEPRANEELTGLLKLPIGRDGFFNEIHPKLRPVETLVDGVYIVGTSQGPKDTAETVASALAASAKVTALLRRGTVELAPLIAKVATDQCTWCDECAKACPYDAIEKVEHDGRPVARIHASLCKGGGTCLPVCPDNAIELEGYTDRQIESVIDSYLREVS